MTTAFLLLVGLPMPAGAPTRAVAQDRPGAAAPAPVSVDVPNREPIPMRPVAKLPPGPVKENSGIVRSRQFPDLFWMHNDSGDEPRVYPIHRNGEAYRSTREPETPGVLIGGAINVDWEDITVDSDGNLIVADVGNNGNDRRDLVLYYIPEPSPDASRTTFRKKVFVRYPGQKDFPAPRSDFNYDCEAVFTVGNAVHLLTKHRSDTSMKLYRLDHPKAEQTNDLTFLEAFDVRDKAVGADATPDGKRVVVVTYKAIWLFERDDASQPLFGGRISYAPYQSPQVEAVCFADDKSLLLADEETGQLFEVELSGLTRLR
ncbi:hypothetical protein [Aquisphaera giovannonii]|uniref:hypothetical protein n=1 Tax=Aquisphaera giovannonii TaxID=406548 RepID=UPI0011DF5174|nr:hypothetical protein [Aquisphaera giovannonii]